MHIELLTHTPEPEKLLACAAKLCYSSVTIDELYDGLTPEKTKSFVNMLESIGHESPIEHISFTFGIEGISRACSHQLVRHRIASYSQQSQRYVSMDNFEYVIPPEIANDEISKQMFKKTMQNSLEAYNQLADTLTGRYTDEYISNGIDLKAAKSKARKRAQEDARFVLPNACTTSIIVTMNARSLMNFFRHRCCNRAQWEIKAVADEMLKLVLKLAPTLFAHAGPPCMRGGCPEGKMSCGQINEVRKKYSEILEC